MSSSASNAIQAEFFRNRILEHRVWNVNLGILGHIDSGKTSLARALSMVASTASFDKHPQSRERGITLDLGFSSFSVPLPTALLHELEAKEEISLSSLSVASSSLSPSSPSSPSSSSSSLLSSSSPVLSMDSSTTDTCGSISLQFTIVDCPGHASLIRTVLGGAQVIDSVLLVVDVNKGIQPQTAECIVIAEILARDMVVVLNKIDTIPESERTERVSKVISRLEKVFSSTRFASCPIVPVSASTALSLRESGEGSLPSDQLDRMSDLSGIQHLIEVLRSRVQWPHRPISAPFLCSIDHCFSVKGVGTVLTGTVLSGKIATGKQVYVPASGSESHRIRSIQVFHKTVDDACAGDRIGMAVQNLSSDIMERGLVGESGHLCMASVLVCSVHPIEYFKLQATSRSKFHITVAHSTVIATAVFYSEAQSSVNTKNSSGDVASTSMSGSFDTEYDSFIFDEYLRSKHQPVAEELRPVVRGKQYVYFELETPIIVYEDALFIASRLDSDLHTPLCRLAFHGTVLRHSSMDDACKIIPRIFRWKLKTGVIERATDDRSIIVKNLFSKETDLSVFLGCRVLIGDESGVILSSFGQSGKVKVTLDRPVAKSCKGQVQLFFKKFTFDPETDSLGGSSSLSLNPKKAGAKSSRVQQ